MIYWYVTLNSNTVHLHRPNLIHITAEEFKRLLSEMLFTSTSLTADKSFHAVTVIRLCSSAVHPEFCSFFTASSIHMWADTFRLTAEWSHTPSQLEHDSEQWPYFQVGFHPLPSPTAGVSINHWNSAAVESNKHSKHWSGRVIDTLYFFKYSFRRGHSGALVSDVYM